MPLTILNFPDNLDFLKETHRLWSAGLSYGDYLEYNEMQKRSVWGKRHLQLVGYRAADGELKASCKLYKLTLASRGKSYDFLGIGALYCLKDFRNQGYARGLLTEVLDRAQDNEQSVILFSDIGSDFYGSLGFQDMSSLNFVVELGENFSGGESFGITDGDYNVRNLVDSNIDDLERLYGNWLRRQKFGFVRDHGYWQYKITKEDFLNRRSKLSWPKLSCLTEKNANGYCIFEQGGPTLRLLELVANQDPERLWFSLLDYCKRKRIKILRGWEGNLADFAPGFSLKTRLSSGLFYDSHFAGMSYLERGWGRPMLVSESADDLSNWLNATPCPLIELDHL